VATLYARNVANTGNLLVLDLTADPPDGTHGLPTQLTWTVDGSSGGIWQNAAGFGTGQGTLDFRYSPSGRSPRGKFASGSVSLVFQGFINTSGTGNVLASPGNRP